MDIRGHGSFGDVIYYRYGPAKQRMLEAGGMEEAIAADHFERIGPVLLVPGSARSSGWTVAFPVQADGETNMWIQHWEDLWASGSCRCG